MTKSIDEADTNQRFLDEAGDTTFYGKGKVDIIGDPGVSKCFILGLVKFRQPLEQVRAQVRELQKAVESDKYYRLVPSIQRKTAKRSFYFHATDDLPEVRKTFFDFIRGIDCSCEAVVGRKLPNIYERRRVNRHKIPSHLLKNKFQKERKLVLTIAQRGKSTRNSVLELARQKAITRFTDRKTGREIRTDIAFNIQNNSTEPLLNVADYFCWAIQRVFEMGEVRYYDFLADKIPVVVDLYDQEKYENWGNYYGPKQPLTSKNKIGPSSH